MLQAVLTTRQLVTVGQATVHRLSGEATTFQDIVIFILLRNLKLHMLDIA